MIRLSKFHFGQLAPAATYASSETTETTSIESFGERKEHNYVHERISIVYTLLSEWL